MTLKRVSHERNPQEVEIASSEPFKSDPRNRCIPIYEVLNVPNDDDKSILVMPLFRRYDDPKFQTVGEVLEFFHQIFEVHVSLLHESYTLTSSDTRRVHSKYPHIWLLLEEGEA